MIDGSEITVLGGGVNGITSALTLELLGYDTQVVTDRLAYQGEDETPPPWFPTAIGAGIVLPYVVAMDDLDAAFADAEAVFGRLDELGCSGVHDVVSYWIVEEASGRPDDLDPFDDVTEVAPDALPSRDGIDVRGWELSPYFVEMPHYVDQLYRWYRAVGGRIEQRRVERDDLGSLSGLLVNCTGIRSTALFPDDATYAAVRGHLVRSPGAFPRDERGRVVSYNYVSTDHDAETYCFPRVDGLFLGGTHQHSVHSYRPGEVPAFPPIDEPTRDVDGVKVPSRVVDRNADLLAHFGVTVPDDDELDAVVGYRPYRAPADGGVRLELAQEACGPVVHNYGHGGAGITLSWGCGVRVARLVEGVLGDRESTVDVPARHAALARLHSTLERLV